MIWIREICLKRRPLNYIFFIIEGTVQPGHVLVVRKACWSEDCTRTFEEKPCNKESNVRHEYCGIRMSAISTAWSLIKFSGRIASRYGTLSRPKRKLHTFTLMCIHACADTNTALVDHSNINPLLNMTQTQRATLRSSEVPSTHKKTATRSWNEFDLSAFL